MAESIRRVVWAHVAQEQKNKILAYWRQRNGNSKYSFKLQNLINHSVNILTATPYIGKKSTFEGVRIYVIRDYWLMYQVKDREIRIVAFWDTRQNPEKLGKKLGDKEE